jgi:hypothetical protein
MTFDELTRYDNRRLDVFMSQQPAPQIRDLLGFAFRGWNIQSTTAILGTRKFFKGFFGDATKPHAWGYNMPAVQDGRERPWRAKTKDGQPIRYYFFKVVAGSALKDSVHPHTLVVDYRPWRAYSALNPVKYTVDYLVYPDPHNHDLLVGKSYSQVLGMRLFLGFFILERFGPSGFTGPPGFAL